MTDPCVEAVARAISLFMHDSRKRAWDDGLLLDGQKTEAKEAARAAIAALRSKAKDHSGGGE